MITGDCTILIRYETKVSSKNLKLHPAQSEWNADWQSTNYKHGSTIKFNIFSTSYFDFFWSCTEI